jgi:nitroimidazol reductase NimA-like FMN-containing flavoprotein (pyridoxamine 5'-phosphate oxidase superfamily)
MHVVENTLDCAIDTFLDRPLFAFLGQVADGDPRVSPLWFLWEDDRLWHIAQLDGRSYPERIRRDSRVAVGIVDFEPESGRVEHVGIRGEASLRDYDRDRADRLLAKYLGDDRDDWPERFAAVGADGFALIEIDPETVVARDQSYSL